MVDTGGAWRQGAGNIGTAAERGEEERQRERGKTGVRRSNPQVGEGAVDERLLWKGLDSGKKHVNAGQWQPVVHSKPRSRHSSSIQHVATLRANVKLKQS